MPRTFFDEKRLLHLSAVWLASLSAVPYSRSLASGLPHLSLSSASVQRNTPQALYSMGLSAKYLVGSGKPIGERDGHALTSEALAVQCRQTQRDAVNLPVNRRPPLP